MKVAVFGATGMVGQGVLRECLLDPAVSRVVAVGRRGTGRSDPKLVDLVVPDLFDLSAAEGELSGADACFTCLGVSSVGMAEAEYARVTRDLTLSVAKTLLRLAPAVTFVFVSGAGTDASGKGSSMWARVKGETENELLRLPFRRAAMFRPAFIQPMHGVVSRTPLYRALYSLLAPATPLLRALFPAWVTTTERVGRAMLRVARDGSPKPVLENREIDLLGR